jgi:hypothetical protein
MSPTKFPAWLTKPDGSIAQVNDINSYTGAAQQGWVYPLQAQTARTLNGSHIVAAGTPITPSTALTPTVTLTQISNNKEQDDGRF